MKNKRLAKVWSKSHLPTDLWPLILCRVSVKTLLRFRCISKSWLSMINEPDFARLHLKSFKNNPHKTNLLVVHRQQCVIRCSDTFRANSATLLSNLGMMCALGSWNIVGSLDGLVVLKSHLKGLKVWNPSIRKFHEFPSFSEIETSRVDQIKYSEIGLGYNLLAKVYKHVRLIFVRDIMHSVVVYTLDTKSWKTIQFQSKGCSKEQWQPEFDYKNAVYIHGSLYFIADFMPIITLLSFDMSSEVFSVVSIHDDNHAFRSSIVKGYSTLRLIDNGRSLAVFHLAPFEKSVWVLETSRERR